MTLLDKDDDSKVESCCVTSDARHPRVCLRKIILLLLLLLLLIIIIIIIIIKTYNYKWPVCLLLSLLARFWPFRPGYGLSGLCLAWLWPFWSVFGPSDTLYNLTICEKDVICVQSTNCQHGLQESLQKVSDSIFRG